MAKGQNLGEFELLVMLAVQRCPGGGRGATILAELETRARRFPSLAAVHMTLSRLEGKGLLRSREEPAPPGRGGRPRRLYSLTRDGAAVVRDARRTLERMWSDLPLLAE